MVLAAACLRNGKLAAARLIPSASIMIGVVADSNVFFNMLVATSSVPRPGPISIVSAHFN